LAEPEERRDAARAGLLAFLFELAFFLVAISSSIPP
jgi:hypothetical protein